MADQQGQEESTKVPAPTPATRAYKYAARQMHNEMGISYSSDPDEDFAAILAAHHKGAIALAQVELQYGKDKKMRKLAETVIETRKREIALIEAWQVEQSHR